MKKLLLVFMLIISVVCLPPSAHSIDNKYNFSDYADFLESKVFPDIQKYIDGIKPEPFTKKQSKQIADDVFNILSKSFNSGELLSKFPPKVTVSKYGNKQRDVYILEVILILVDSEASIQGKFVASLLFGKRFVIYIHEKSSLKIPSKTLFLVLQ